MTTTAPAASFFGTTGATSITVNVGYLELKHLGSKGGSEKCDVDVEVGTLRDYKIPSEIRDKTYTSSEEFEKDLEAHGLQDCKYISLDLDGKAYWKIVAGPFHKTAVKSIRKLVQEAEVEVYVDMEPTLEVSGSHWLIADKEPDLAIWGPDRLGDDEEPKEVSVTTGASKRRKLTMNPNVIIEFSWSNELKDEIAKFSAQMTKHTHASVLGKVELGYLIKTIPLHKNRYPRGKDTSAQIRENPIVGFDVFKAGAGEKLNMSTDRHLTYRVGNEDEDDSALEITGKDLDIDSKSEEILIRIPLSVVREALEEKRGVVFQQELEDEEDGVSA